MWQYHSILAFLSTLFVWKVAANTVYEVKGLEKYGTNDVMHAGFMNLDKESNKLGSFFFWLAEQRNRDEDQPRRLIIWLNGGPGCSSMVGMMWENGPFTIHFGDDEKYELKNNPYAWNEIADVMFVEQPLRTGFSIASDGANIIRNEEQIGSDFRLFLLSFLDNFPQYKNVEMYLSGESYAGFYIPWIAEHIVSHQLVPSTSNTLPTTETSYTRDPTVDGINLVGAAIGNGVLDYIFQEPSYAEYAYSHGLIPLAAKQKFDLEWEQCLESLQKLYRPLTRGNFNKCHMMDKVLAAAGKPNEYNTATFVGYDQIIQPGSAFDTFSQDPEIQTILHVRGMDLPGINFIPEDYDLIPQPDKSNSGEDDENHTEGENKHGNAQGMYYQPPKGWKVCNDNINTQMSRDHPITAVPVLQFLADFTTAFNTDVQDPRQSRAPTLKRRIIHGENNHIKILLYSGEFDLNCNTLGTLHTLEHNQWRKKNWDEAERSLWRFQNDVAGEYFTFDDAFSFLIVRNSGHLLPMDLPQQALEMMRRFLNDESFADTPLPSERSYKRETQQLTQQQQLAIDALLNDVGYVALFSSIMVLLFLTVCVFSRQEHHRRLVQCLQYKYRVNNNTAYHPVYGADKYDEEYGMASRGHSSPAASVGANHTISSGSLVGTPTTSGSDEVLVMVDHDDIEMISSSGRQSRHPSVGSSGESGFLVSFQRSSQGEQDRESQMDGYHSAYPSSYQQRK